MRGSRRNDEQAALGRQKLSVLFAGPLREDEQGLAVFAGLNGLLDGSHLILCAAHAHRAAAPEEPCQEAVDLEQLLLGKYAGIVKKTRFSDLVFFSLLLVELPIFSILK